MANRDHEENSWVDQTLVSQASQPQALVAHGHYEEAIQAYQVCCADYPKDPEPYLCIARLYRNELQRFDDALIWFTGSIRS